VRPAVQFNVGVGADSVRHRLDLAAGAHLIVTEAPFLPTCTTVTLCSMKVVQLRPLLMRQVRTR